jgi:hypothetical protein
MSHAETFPSSSLPRLELLTVEQFAERLQVSRTTVFGWLKKGVLTEGAHYLRIGRILRLRWPAVFSLNSQTMSEPSEDSSGTPPLSESPESPFSLTSQTLPRSKEDLPGRPPPLPSGPSKKKRRSKHLRRGSKPAINLDY